MEKNRKKELNPLQTIDTSLSLKTNTENAIKKESTGACLNMKKFMEIRENVINSLEDINYLRLQSEVYHKNVVAKLRLVNYNFEEKKLSVDDYKSILKSLLEEVSLQVDEVQKINGKVKDTVNKLSSEVRHISTSDG